MGLNTRVNETTQLAVGQEIVLCRMGSFDVHYVFGYKVTKVTPTGRITIQRDAEGMVAASVKQFNKHGEELGANAYHNLWLDTDVAGIRQLMADRASTRKAVVALKLVRTPDSFGTDKTALLNMVANLETKLAAAKAAVLAMHQNV